MMSLRSRNLISFLQPYLRPPSSQAKRHLRQSEGFLLLFILRRYAMCYPNRTTTSCLDYFCQLMTGYPVTYLPWRTSSSFNRFPRVKWTILMTLWGSIYVRCLLPYSYCCHQIARFQIFIIHQLELPLQGLLLAWDLFLNPLPPLGSPESFDLFLNSVPPLDLLDTLDRFLNSLPPLGLLNTLDLFHNPTRRYRNGLPL